MNKYLIIFAVLLLGLFGWKFSQSENSGEHQTPITQTGLQVSVSSEASSALSGTTKTFIPPNTNWPTRTLSGITYVFGEGNPKEVALQSSQLKSCSYQESPSSCTDSAGYVTTEVEQLLRDMLSDSNWKPLLTNCDKEFSETDSNPYWKGTDVNLASLTEFPFLSMEQLLVINPVTGRKELRKTSDKTLPELLLLRDYLVASTWYGHNREEVNPGYSKCVDTYGTSIINQLSNIVEVYLNPRDAAPNKGESQYSLTPISLPLGSDVLASSGTNKSFTLPNTNWSTRTLSGITYVFGEGNPKEVALSLDKLKKVSKTCETDDMSYVLYRTDFCNHETGTLKYLSADAEKHILAALLDPNWGKLATECEKAFRSVETPDTFENAKDNPNFPYFDRVFAPGFLDIENFISVDPVTGWKKLNTGLTIGLSNFLMQATLQGQIETLNPSGDCVDRYAREIVRNFEIATVLYLSPLDYQDGVYSGALNSSGFSIPHHFF